MQYKGFSLKNVQWDSNKKEYVGLILDPQRSEWNWTHGGSKVSIVDNFRTLVNLHYAL